ncbi:MAG TPA: M23 family metallopeptidase [Actinomycetota bacterium]
MSHRRVLVPLLLGALIAAAAGCSGGRARPAAASGSGGSGTSASATTAATPSTASAATTGTTAPPSTTGAAHYVFPVQGCASNYGHFHHDYPATDIFTSKGCRFVAVTDGVVSEVNRIDRWDPKTNLGADRGGRSVAIVGVDGVRYYGSHLLSVATGIEPGVHLHAGQLLGLVDNSGDARFTATHVHFGISWPTGPGIWWIRRGVLYPWPYLDSWRAGGSRSPATAVKAALAAAGTPTPPCRAEC